MLRVVGIAALFGYATAAQPRPALPALALRSASPADALITAAGSIPLPGVVDGAHTMKLDHNVIVGARMFLSAKECVARGFGAHGCVARGLVRATAMRGRLRA